MDELDDISVEELRMCTKHNLIIPTEAIIQSYFNSENNETHN